jgi:ABC-type glutathione transport system ATPase component
MSGLQVKNLSLAFRAGRGASSQLGSPVLDQVSWTLEPGQALGLLGASGSGKSLSALATLGLLPAGAEILGGEIEFEGQNLLAMDAETLRTQVRGKGIGLVFQEPFTALNPLMRVGDQIAESLSLHKGLDAGAAAKEAAAWLDRVGLTPGESRARQYPHQYSGGMRQRALIALALAPHPRLLIADEPTTALDATVQAQVLGLVDRLRQELGFGLLIISHDLGVIRRLADKAVVMEKGRVVEQGSVSSLLQHPQSPAAQRLMAAYRVLAGA